MLLFIILFMPPVISVFLYQHLIKKSVSLELKTILYVLFCLFNVVFCLVIFTYLFNKGELVLISQDLNIRFLLKYLLLSSFITVLSPVILSVLGKNFVVSFAPVETSLKDTPKKKAVKKESTKTKAKVSTKKATKKATTPKKVKDEKTA